MYTDFTLYIRMCGVFLLLEQCYELKNGGWHKGPDPRGPPGSAGAVVMPLPTYGGTVESTLPLTAYRQTTFGLSMSR